MALQRAKQLARKKGEAVGERAVRELHERLFHDAWPDIAGNYRTSDIDAFAPIGDLPPHFGQVPQEMWQFNRECAERVTPPPADAAEAVELATWLHMEIVRIHPFQEGNGRTARLAMNVLLMRHVTGAHRPVNIPVSMRERYVDCVQAARQGRPEAFHALIADALELMVEREQRWVSLRERLKSK